MLGVLLTILKVIAIILAVICGLVIGILALILFVPVRYKIAAEKNSGEESSVKASVNISYLLHIISVWINYNENLVTKVKIFGIDISRFKKKSKAKEQSKSQNKKDKNRNKKEKNKINDIKESSDETVANTESAASDILESECDEPAAEYTIDWNDEVKEPEEKQEEEIPDSFNEKLGKYIDKIKQIYCKCIDFFENVSDKADVISDKIQRLIEKINNYSNIISDGRNQEAVSKLLGQVKYLLRHLLPRKISGFIHFGMDDPATTGQILVYCSILAPVTPRKLIIEPDFESVCAEGNVLMKGHFAAITLLVAGWKVYFDKNIRRLWNMIKKK